jgi:uncharacterized Zn-binding protein involved in type VI secretion
MPGRPAARILDPVAHPLPGMLTPGPGSPNVTIGYKLAWRGVLAAAAAAIQSAKQTSDATIKAAETATLAAAGTPGLPAAKAAEQTTKATAAASMASMIAGAAGGADMHACLTPLPLPPHGPGVVIDGSQTVLINNLTACRQGDTIIEPVGPPDKIVMGEPTVIIGDAGTQALENLLSDPTVRAAIDQAWTDSNPNGPGAKMEHGFWIVQDNTTKALSIKEFPTGGSTNQRMIPGPTPSDPNSTPVAFFHTHPNTSAEGYRQAPSGADQAFAINRNIPGILKAHDGMYYFGP